MFTLLFVLTILVMLVVMTLVSGGAFLLIFGDLILFVFMIYMIIKLCRRKK